jgi:transcriptional regulator with GAF, ATPase, and Fis domain
MLPRITSHRGIIVGTGAVVFAYATWVLWYVIQVPELGISSTAQLVVNRIDLDYVDRPATSVGESYLGWTVASLGDEAIHSWPQWVRAVRDLREHTATLAPSETHRIDQAGDHWVRVAVTNGTRTDDLWCRVGRVAPGLLLPSVLWIVLEAGLFVVAAIVFWKRPKDAGVRMFYLQSLVVIGAFMGGYHWVRICTQPLLTSIYIICAVLLPAVNLHFFLSFPRRKAILLRRPLATLAAVYAVPGIFLALILVSFAVVRWLSRSGGAPEQVNLALAWLRDTVFVYIAVAAGWYVASIFALVHGFFAARDLTEREQHRWLLIGTALALIPIGYSVFLANRHPIEFSGGAASWPMFLASACVTFAFAVAITRYRLLQFDQLLSSGLAYFLVSGFAALIYCALVVSGMLLFGARGPSLEQAAWVGGSALVLSISLDAARLRLRKYLDRRFRKDKTQIDHILHQLGEAVDQLVDPPTLAVRLLQVSAELYGYPRGSVFIRDRQSEEFQLAGSLGLDHPVERLDESGELVAALRHQIGVERHGLPPAHPVRRELAALGGDVAVALTHEKSMIGVLVLARAPGQSPRAGDVALLASFAPIAAMAIAGADVRCSVDLLNRELQGKIEKISEQQRRIFSLQQQLVAQSRRFPKPADEPAVLAPPAAAALDNVLGSSPALQRLLDLVPRVAANSSAVLIRGESGTGKELIARALHDLSPRVGNAFVKVHCAALAPGVLESELFGHVKGAFTGAMRDKPGRFEAANGGTLFLDEIGDITPEVQTKLLRVLQEQTFERVGSNDSVRVDVRLVTATHQDLERLIRDGRFRSDLYYRLNVITLQMPPLRQRGEDVIELAHHLLAACSARCRKSVDAIDDDALLALRNYAWPGNIRELENVIERAVVVCDGTTLRLEDLPEEITRPVKPKAGTPARAGLDAVRSARAARHAREREEIRDVLERTGWNRAEASRQLGMARSTLLSRMKRYGLTNVGTHG